MKILILLLIVTSCGKRKEEKKCLSRYQKVMECYQDYNDTHNRAYVNRVCGEQYRQEGCYK